MRLLAISDLHIRGSDDPIYRSLLTLLRDHTQKGDTLVLAGDLFDLFVGNKKIFRSRYHEFFEALHSCGIRGIPVHYIEGNHDFQIRQAFRGIPKFELHSQSVHIELCRKKFFVAHGDLVDSKDYGYRLLRGFFRSPLMTAFITVAPGKLIDGIGKKSSETSRKKKPLLTHDLPREKMESLRLIYRNYAAEKIAEGYDFVIMGHCHDLDSKKFIVDGRPGQYINVGYPRAHGSYLVWELGDKEIQRVGLPEVSAPDPSVQPHYPDSSL